MTEAGIRVYKLAKEIGVSSRELVAELTELGVSAKNHFAIVDSKSAALLREKFRAGSGKSKASAQTQQEVREKMPSIEEETYLESPERTDFPEKETGQKEKGHDRHAKKLKELKVIEKITVKEFAELIGRSPADVIKQLIELGEMVTINQPLDDEAINILAEELGYEAKIVAPEEESGEYEESNEDLEPRPPVVTVMGHVDHGKTSLLDAIRKTDVISQEAGGITQHIGAYQIVHDGKKITFIDTPGHEAFTAMRARGAQVTDVAVLVVAADDGVMPQTVEAIDHAREAKVPIVVAINKIDKPEANPNKVKQELTEYELVPEEWGGDTVFVEVSAKKKINIDELLEMILLVSEIQELKANRKCPASGVTIEAKLDKGRGPVAAVLIKRGILKIGDAITAGLTYGKVRALVDDKGNLLKEAEPAQPVEVLGLSTVPHAGDEAKVVADEKVARQIASERALKRRLIEQARQHVTLDDLFERIQEGQVKELKLILKADTQGSIEAIAESLEKIDQEEVKLNIIHRGVGGITETDVMLASASDAIIIGFNVRPDAKASEMAIKEGVDLRTYRVIYKVIEDITAARLGMLAPKYEEVEQGRAEVRETFRVSKVGMIAGCFIHEGEIKRDSLVRLVRDGTVIYEGKIASLRRFKDDVSSVKAGLECGIRLEDFQDVKVGDIIEGYAMVEKSRT
jgi:translation initiation factor IF-2